MEDHQLAAAAAEGGQEAFATLVERYRALIYAIAYKIALNEEDALDISQDVFLRLTQKLGDFQGRGPFRSWLSALTAHAAVDFLRRPARRESPTEPGVLTLMADRRQAPQDAGDAGHPLAALEHEARQARVESVLHELSPQQRAVFVLRYREEMEPREIAERLGIPAKQVRSQLHRAIGRIRETLGLLGSDEEMSEEEPSERQEG